MNHYQSQNFILKKILVLEKYRTKIIVGKNIWLKDFCPKSFQLKEYFDPKKSGVQENVGSKKIRGLKFFWSKFSKKRNKH